MEWEEPRPMKEDFQYKIIAQGNTAEVYLYGSDKILKLFRKGMPKEPIMAEFKKAQAIQAKLENTPRVYGTVESQGRYGIVYERAVGTDMINVMLGNLFQLNMYSKSLASMHAELHGVQLEFGCTVKEKLRAEIDAVSELSQEEKKSLTDYLHQLPDGNALCHFDFHPGNVILQKKKPFIIDWMTACTGDSNADVARTYLLLQFGELQHAHWVVRKLAHFFEKQIGKKYIQEYKRLAGISDSAYEQWLLPVAAARLAEWLKESERKQLVKFVRERLRALKK